MLPEGISGDTEDLDVDVTSHPSENVGTIDEAVESPAVPEKHNEEFVEAWVPPEGVSGSPEDLDVDSSDNISANVGTMVELL